jgi:hypothetical protein
LGAAIDRDESVGLEEGASLLLFLADDVGFAFLLSGGEAELDLFERRFRLSVGIFWP